MKYYSGSESISLNHKKHGKNGGLLKKLTAILLSVAMVLNLVPGLNLGLTAHAASGMVTFSAVDCAPIEQTLSDGKSGSQSLLTGGFLNIYNAMKNNVASPLGTFTYYAQSTISSQNPCGVVCDTDQTTEVIVIKSKDGARFNFKSIYVFDISGDQKMEPNICFQGYYNGTLIGSPVTCTLSKENQGIYEETFQFNQFDNVNEIRISNASGGVNVIGINNIQIGDSITATTNNATNISVTGATLNGVVNANDANVTVSFEYGATTTYGSTVTSPSSVGGAIDTPVSANLTGLAPNTTYHYRVVGKSTNGTTVYGGDKTFTTLDPSIPIITTVAGGGSNTTYNNINATDALMYSPCKVKIDSNGNLYIADYDNGVCKVDALGKITTILDSTKVSNPCGLALDAAENLYISESTSNRILKFNSSTHALTVLVDSSAGLQCPQGIVFDSAGNFYISDSGNNRVLKRDANTGTVTPFITDGLNNPDGLAFDSAGNLYISSVGNHVIYKINKTDLGSSTIQKAIIAGKLDAYGYKTEDEGNNATSATLNNPCDITIDSLNNLFIADCSNNRLRKVDVNGKITTVAGGGAVLGDNGPALSAALSSPQGVATDNSGNLYIADKDNNRVRKVALPLSVISTAAIAGVTAPVTGVTPVSSIAATDEYTASISWSPNDAAFKSNTIYTAIITIAPKAGHTLNGVASNYFTVNGATTANAANSGVVTAAFPATDAVITTAAISGVTPPVTGATPVSSIAATSEYTASISWSPNDTTFKANTIYTATVTIVPKAGHTLNGVASNYFTVNGATAANAANSGVVTAAFPATDATIATAAIAGVTAPVTGATPVSSIAATDEYTASISWSPNDTTFKANTIYTATITIVPKAGHTLNGVASNYFTVNGAATANAANSGVVTAAFPATDATIATAAIAGVTAPVTGATPVSSIAATNEYTASISWSPNDATFKANTIYTATITIVPKAGHTLNGVASNYFTVNGAATANAANSGVVTAAFPATDATIATAAIAGVTAPVTGATPVSSIAATDEYTASISWSPNDAAFKANTIYTAIITIAPKAEHTLNGVASNYFTVNGATAANAANSGVVTAAFPATALDAPTLSATAGDRSVDLTWNSVTGATSYKIYIGASTGIYSTPVATVSNTSTTITGLTNGTTYYFVVKASNAGGDSINSNEANAQPQATVVTATVNSVSASNGMVSIVLDKSPTVTPTAADFSATNKIDGGTENSLPLSNFVWNAGTKTVTFCFMPIAQTLFSQSVVIAVSYKGTAPISSAAFTVDAAPTVNKTLDSITAPTAITGVVNGTAKTAAALGLPSTVVLVTNNGNVNANVSWNVASSNYDASKTTEQTFTVNGTVTLPAGVVNTNGIALTTTISVTVKSASGGTPTNNTITGFILDDAIKSQTVANGTIFSLLNLPDKLKAIGDQLANFWVTVTKWVCSIPYQPTVAGIYTYTAVLDSGYVLGSGVSAPEIKITVAEKSSSDHHSDNTSSDTSSSVTTGQTETKVDTTGNTATVTTKPDRVTTNGDTTNIETTVPSVTVDNTATSTNGSTVDQTKKTAVTIDVPTDAIVQQLAAKKDVNLTITVPSDVAKDTNANLAVTINANKEILEAAKENLSDVTIKIKDADTQQLAYSWTFKGEDLAKSTTPMTDVNIAMSIHLTTEVPKVDVITPSNKGLVLSFDHSGVLPSVASVRFSALEKGFKPGQTLYFYYYNPTTKQIESLGKDAYTVGADGYVTVQIVHCSDYVLLPNAARSLTLDTKTYVMAAKNCYEIGVKLTNTKGTTVKVYSSTKGVASITKLKNGNYQVTGLKTGLTYIMFDVYDEKGKLIAKAHASVRLTVKNGVKPSGNSARQIAIF